MIQYEVVSRERYAECADFLVNNFFVHEPFGLALGKKLHLREMQNCQITCNFLQLYI